MPIYELTEDSIVAVEQVTLASQRIRERYDLQRLLRANIEAISSETFVLAEEYNQWEESKRSIDLLCLDKQANLVVIELKRTEDGGHMELQSIRYAAMVSKMTFADAVAAHSIYLTKIGKNPDDACSAILKFLEWDEPLEADFGQDTRIVLVSADFNKEITTAVLWLNERDLDIRCVRLRPYKAQDKILLDIQQMIPLPEAAAYQVQLRKKAFEERQAKKNPSDWSRYDLEIAGVKYLNLRKRHLFLHAVRGLVKLGVPASDLQSMITATRLVGIPGELAGNEFRAVAFPESSDRARRFFTDDGELFESEGKTWALSNQWSISRLPLLDEFIKKYPTAKISYSKSTDTTDS